ncbi:recombinase family protein [Rummeliibacillus pycnus]|uniref:recombinase family protein n=1 Tax=Rummeliibacillus pycnus TaxID=101070 RepID=UPI003D275131
MTLSEFLKTKELQAAFYGRHSTDEQNVETQRFICHEFAEKYGITIIDDYVDENKSAFKNPLNKRAHLDRLRKDARERKFDCVLVYKADRLARRIDQHMQLWGEFRELGIPIILTESEKLYTTDSPTEIMVEVGLSSLEAENTRIRTRDSYNSKTAKGKWLGGILPYGFQYEKDKNGNSIMIPIPHQIDNVKEIFNYYKRGYGFKRIAALMNEKHPKDTMGKWVAESIKSIITNPYYAGYTTSQRIVPGSGNSVQDRSEWKKGKCDKIPAVIPEEEWNECMELYEEKKKGKITRNKYITPYLFIDILHCKSCKQKVIGKNYTPGKRKKDGGKYEDQRFYICKGCKQKWDVNKVHEYLFSEIMGGWHYQYLSRKKEEIQSDIMEKIQEEIQEIEESIKTFKKDLFKYTDKLKEVEIKQKALMEKNPEPDDLQHALVQYRISVQKRIDLYEKEIQKKENEKQQLYLSYGDVENFKEITKQFTGFKYDFTQPEFRKLVLFLLDKVTISGKEEYQYEIMAKVDLSERGTIFLGFN